ncbi:hypothetical protein WH95_11260 [Kiloniella litopenaei]|uniref:ABM domain-containing protein n=1 Tax=Kiloniella litopenaei TaxID=1549748 RepID=A0A0M2R9Q6_9PROT|nr:hypothetical protein WH95_11260 [Kiloniella litopenaei]
MYVVLVDFEIKPEFVKPFKEAMLLQATTSLKQEEDCTHFDVCQAPDEPHKFFLYECYTDASAFDTHLQSDHFLAFDQIISNWIAHKEVRCLELISS